MKTLIPKPLSLVCVFFAQDTEQVRKPHTVTEDAFVASLLRKGCLFAKKSLSCICKAGEGLLIFLFYSPKIRDTMT